MDEIQIRAKIEQKNETKKSEQHETSGIQFASDSVTQFIKDRYNFDTFQYVTVTTVAKSSHK